MANLRPVHFLYALCRVEGKEPAPRKLSPKCGRESVAQKEAMMGESSLFSLAGAPSSMHANPRRALLPGHLLASFASAAWRRHSRCGRRSADRTAATA